MKGSPGYARQRVNESIEQGLLHRQPCEVCGATMSGSRPIDAHHRYGYEDPLRVVWLCRRHHLQEHGHPAGEVFREVLRLLAAGVSQSEAARRTGVTRQRVHQIRFRHRVGFKYKDRPPDY